MITWSRKKHNHALDQKAKEFILMRSNERGLELYHNRLHGFLITNKLLNVFPCTIKNVILINFFPDFHKAAQSINIYLACKDLIHDIFTVKLIDNR